MKTVLERAEEVNREISQLKLKNLKLLSLKIADYNPHSGSFRIKGFVSEDSFIEIFEFLYLGEVLKYSYSFVKNEKSLLRYDNAPHYTEIQTKPHHKHLKGKIYPLEMNHIGEFIKEVAKIMDLK